MTTIYGNKTRRIEYRGPHWIQTTGPSFSIFRLTIPVRKIDLGQKTPKPQISGQGGAHSSPAPGGTGQDVDGPDKTGD
jgi:hypothetical protein